MSGRAEQPTLGAQHILTKGKLAELTCQFKSLAQGEIMRIFGSDMVFVASIALSLVAVAACQPDGRIDALGERIDSLEQMLTAVETGVDTPVGPVDPPNQRLTDAENGIGSLGEHINSLEQRLTTIETGIDAPIGTVAPPNQRLTDAENGFGALGERMDSLEQRLIAVEAGIAALGEPDDTGELTTDGDSTGSRDVKVMEVTVGPRLLDCVGVGPRKCLEVNGQFFYEGIDGFKHEEGYTYRLKIERYDAFPGEKEPPQDASRYGYRLIEVMSKAAP